MRQFLRRLLGSDPRIAEAERKHSQRTAELEKANTDLDGLLGRLATLGQESQREGIALAHVLEEINSLRPGALEPDGGPTKP